MTGRLGGLVTLLRRAATFDVLRLWCGLYQVDLVAQDDYQRHYCDYFESETTVFLCV